MSNKQKRASVIRIFIYSLSFLSLALLLLYSSSLASYFAAPPSAIMSKEISVGETQFSQNYNAEYHIAYIPLEDGGTWLATIDGNDTRILHLDRNGEVLSNTLLGLDLYRAIQLDATILADGRMAIYYLQDGLWRVLVNLDNFSYTSEKIAGEGLKLAVSRNFLYYQTVSALFAVPHDNPERRITLQEGNIVVSWAHTDGGDRDILMLTSHMSRIYDVDLIELQHDSGEVQRYAIYENTNNSHVKLVEDVWVQDDILTVLYLWTDTVNKLNYFMVQHIALENGTILSEYLNHHAIHYSRFRIAAVRPDGTTDIIMPAKTLSGENLVLATLSGQYRMSFQEITKTRHFSRIIGWRELSDRKNLLFSDFYMTKRLIQFASDDPELMRSASDLKKVDFRYVAFLTLLMLVLATFMASVGHLLPTMLPAFIVIMGLDQKLKPASGKALKQFSLGALVQTLLKLGITWLLVHRTAFREFHPLLLGEEPLVYLVVFLTSMFSWLISAGAIKLEKNCSNATIAAFKLYLISDFVAFTTLVFMYAATNLIIGKL